MIRKFFTPEVGLLADGIVLRHVLEHVVDPVAFLGGLLESNGGEGRIYIEVPCLDWIVRHDAWFDIFYEHVNYFRLADFERMFGTLHEVGHAFDGQYLYAVADLATLRMPRARARDDFPFPPGFMSSFDACEARLAAQPPRRAAGDLGRRVEGRDLRALHGARGNADRHRDRHQSGQAGPLSRRARGCACSRRTRRWRSCRTAPTCSS